MLGSDFRRTPAQRLGDEGGIEYHAIALRHALLGTPEYLIVDLLALAHIRGHFFIEDVLTLEHFQSDKIASDDGVALDLRYFLSRLGLPATGKATGDEQDSGFQPTYEFGKRFSQLIAPVS
ncbi:MAG: hypothetical protein DDT28_00295 [Dehalococcoidia bacterium]|nr:hypothetical protein [Chloroflexota bacterium]